MARQAHCVVRPASAADAKGLAHLENQVRAEGRWLCGDSLTSEEEYLALALDAWSDGSAALVAELDSRLVGWLRLRRLTGTASHVAELEIWVALESRRRGVGSALLAEGFRWARAFHIRKLELGVLLDNLAARALYEGLGFAEEGVLRSYCGRPGGPVDDVLMGLWLGEEPSRAVGVGKDADVYEKDDSPVLVRPASPEDFEGLASRYRSGPPSDLEARIQSSWAADGVLLIAENVEGLLGIADATTQRSRGRHVARAHVSLGPSGWEPALYELASEFRRWGEEFGLTKLEVLLANADFFGSAAAIEILTTAGFPEEARRRGHYLEANVFMDQVLFGRLLD